MNILLTCAGRRSYLVQFFRKALGRRGQVIACDSSRSAPALCSADRRFIVPRMDQPEYIAVQIAICSSNDLELESLAQNAARFRAVGTIPVLAAPRVAYGPAFAEGSPS